MSNEEIHQRIQYLIEHGGIWDDPLEDIRRTARLAAYLSAASLAFTLVAIAHFHF